MKIKHLFFIMFITNIFIYADDNIDEGIFLDDKYNQLDWGDSWEEIVEKVFTNKISGNKIYYTGALYRGSGVFWTYDNNERINILETGVRYGPMIKWHGEFIVEIFIPTGSPFRHSHFYDFRDNMLSPRVDFPIYYDINRDYIISLVDGGLDLYDFKNTLLIKNYWCEEKFSALYLLVFGKYEIKILHNELHFNIIIDTPDINVNRNYIFEYY
jgi:hypothetical protein